MPEDRRCFHTLDGLRGVAAIAVACGHLHNLVGGNLFPGFNLAVDLFFLLSGFVLAHAYEEPLARGKFAGRFLTLRVLRLYPLFLLSLLIAWIGAPIQGLDGTSDWLAQAFNAVCLPAPPTLVPETFPLNRPLWTLCLELAVNVAYAYGFRLWTTRVLLCVWAGAVLLFAGTTWQHGTLVNGLSFADLPAAFIRVVVSFTLGILLRRLGTRRPVESDIRVGLIIGAFTALLLVGSSVQARAAFEVGVVLAVFPILTLWASRTEPHRPGVGRVLARLGRCSYALYVLHIPLATLAVGLARLGFEVDLFAVAPWSGMLLLPALFVTSDTISVRADKPIRTQLAVWFGRVEDRSTEPVNQGGSGSRTEARSSLTEMESFPGLSS